MFTRVLHKPFKSISLLNPRKAAGPDGIPGWVLKENADILAQPISNILNQSYREARDPNHGKVQTLLRYQNKSQCAI